MAAESAEVIIRIRFGLIEPQRFAVSSVCATLIKGRITLDYREGWPRDGVKERFLFPKGAEPLLPRKVTVSSDRAFEVAVLGAVRDAIAGSTPQADRPEISLTPQAADRGRDIVVTGYPGGSLLGLNIEGHETKQSLYIECKLSGRRRLTLDHTAANVLQLEHEPNSIFVLITNATLTPRALSTIGRQCDRLGIPFHLIDAWNFGESLPRLTDDSQIIGLPPQHLVSYQILKDDLQSNRYLVHFVLRSFHSSVTRFEIAFNSTRDWKGIEDSVGDFEVARGGLATWTLVLSPSGPKLPSSFSVALSINGRREIHRISLLARDEVVRLPLFPSDMSRRLEDLRQRLADGNLASLAQVHAKAGLGKSRLLRELFDHARRLAIPCRLARVMNHDTVLIESVLADAKAQQRWNAQQFATFLHELIGAPTGAQLPILLIDDAHLLDAGPLEDIFALTANLNGTGRLIVAGRSDPGFRRPAYEAFVARVASNAVSGHIEQYLFHEMVDADLRAALSRLFEERTAGLIGLGGQTSFKPIDLVHAVHSLMELGHVAWTDEDTLHLISPAEGTADRLWDGSTLGAVLEERYRHLVEIDLGGFNLASFLEILAAVDNASFAYDAVEKLLAESGLQPDILSLWVELNEVARLATFRHSSLQDFLAARFYSFGDRTACEQAMSFMPASQAGVAPRKRAGCAMAAGRIEEAAALIAPFARTLRAVRNISSLDLNEGDYHDYATLFSVLTHGPRKRLRLIFRCVVARAYLNAHFRAYSLGFIDNLRLVGLVEALPQYRGKSLALAAIKQLMAHALINGGDSRTGLSLMHEVESLLNREHNLAAAGAIEFDMCDRLQSFYAHQSAFSTARLFFFRARSCADRLRDNALLNLSFSAEFHLKRYLDIDDSLRLSERQYRHAQSWAPPRALLHARVNCIVSEWSRDGERCSGAQIDEMLRLSETSRRLAFGHLVPRLDYLLAVDAFLEWRAEGRTSERLDRLLKAGLSSARQYGYEDYIWLFSSLEMLRLVEDGAGNNVIATKARHVIEHLHSLGMTFVAGDELCFQSTVVLSNALRALSRHGDQTSAWNAAAKISFSPLFLPRPADRARRIEAVFAGQMLNHIYDPRALIPHSDGYSIILV